MRIFFQSSLHDRDAINLPGFSAAEQLLYRRMLQHPVLNKTLCLTVSPIMSLEISKKTQFWLRLVAAIRLPQPEIRRSFRSTWGMVRKPDET